MGKLRRLGALVLCVLAGSACQYRVVREPDMLVRGLPTDPTSLNPLLMTDVYGHYVVQHVYESLLTQDKTTLEWKPWLAESWEVAPDHLTYTFHLRHDVRWHDGEPFTADDVVFTFDRINDPAVGSPRRTLFGEAGITRAEALDAYTVRFHLTRPYFLALTILGGDLSIVPKHVFAGDTPFAKNPATRAPIGTGPLRFVRWEPGRAIELARNEQYWGTPFGLAGMRFRIIPDYDTLFLTLKKGELDYSSLSELQWFRQADTPGFLARFVKEKFLGQSFGFTYLGWNLRNAKLSDRRVRQALTLLVPRQELIDAIFFGNGQVATGPFHPQSPQGDASIQPWPYDPALAQQLLAAAGWSDHDGDGMLDNGREPLAISFLVSGSSRLIDALANVIRENFRMAGIDLSVRRLEWSVFLKTTREGSFDMMAGAWSNAYESDPYQLWHSSQIASGSNYIGYSNPEVDRLLTDARTTFDVDQRNAMYRRVHQILHEDQPYTFLFVRPSLIAWHHRFTNTTLYPQVGFDLSEWRVGASEELFQ